MSETTSRSKRAGSTQGNPITRMWRTLTLFLRQVVAEMRKVVYPTRDQLLTYTGVVLVFVLIVIALVSALDLLWGQGVRAIFG